MKIQFSKNYLGYLLLPEKSVKLSKVIELTPNDANAFFVRGVTKIDIGSKENGCLDLSKAGELGVTEAYEIIKKYCK